MAISDGANLDQVQIPSIDPDEVEKFSAMAADWWNPHGNFRPLHKFNPVRLGFLRDRVARHFGLDPARRRPLEGLSLIDVGCGGGLVAEPMARLGAQVTAVDASEANIKTALIHAREHGLDINYCVGTVEGMIAAGHGPYDIVLALEVVEHVADPRQFLIDAARLVRPGGLMVVATINRTAKAFALAIVGAEYVLRWLPRGTHDFAKLVRPGEVASALEAAGLRTEPPQGVSYAPLTDSWRLSEDTKVNYMLVGMRPAEAPA